MVLGCVRCSFFLKFSVWAMGNVIFDEKMAGRLMQNLMTFDDDVRIVRLPGEGFKAEPRAPTPQLQAGSLP